MQKKINNHFRGKTLFSLQKSSRNFTLSVQFALSNFRWVWSNLFDKIACTKSRRGVGQSGGMRFLSPVREEGKHFSPPWTSYFQQNGWGLNWRISGDLLHCKSWCWLVKIKSEHEPSGPSARRLSPWSNEGYFYSPLEEMLTYRRVAPPPALS